MKIIFLFISIPICFFSFSQNIESTFIKNGYLNENPNFAGKTACKIKEGDSFIVLDYYGIGVWEVKTKNCKGFIQESFLQNTKEMSSYIIEKVKKVRLEEEIKAKENEKRKIEQKRIEDSISKEKQRLKLLEIEKQAAIDAENQKIQNQIKAEAFEKWRNTCEYELNEIDEFDNVKKIKTKRVNISGYNLTVQLYKIGLENYVIFHSFQDLGCASPYSNNQSYVKVKLQNDDIVSFYHSSDVDCGSFRLFARLTKNDLSRLKKSPIKTVRLSGTEYYHDIEEIEYKEYFIDKLKCLEN